MKSKKNRIDRERKKNRSMHVCFSLCIDTNEHFSTCLLYWMYDRFWWSIIVNEKNCNWIKSSKTFLTLKIYIFIEERKFNLDFFLTKLIAINLYWPKMMKPHHGANHWSENTRLYRITGFTAVLGICLQTEVLFETLIIISFKIELYIIKLT